MIKKARNTNLESQTWKIFVFTLWVSLIKLRILIFLPFFHFRVTWPGNRVRKNLPIDFEIRILNFDRLYGLIYIKRKHVICRIQKNSLAWNSRIMVEIPFTFRYEWSKWPFRTKMNQSGHVIHHSKAYELNISKKTFSWQKKSLLRATSDKNQIFWKILWWRHNHLKWSKSTKISEID